MPNNWLTSKLFLLVAVAVVFLAPATGTAIAADSGEVLATIGDETITQGDLEELANAVPERFRQMYLTQQGRKQTLEYIVNVYALAAEAEKQGLAKTKKFNRLMTFARKDLLARMLLEQKRSELPAPTEQEAKEFYEKNKDQYTTPEAVHIRHILVKSEKEAKKLMAQWKKGASFAELASKHSVCPSKDKGGDLEWMPRGQLVKELEDVAFSMDQGTVSGPVKTKFGYHIVLLEDKKPAQVHSFESVKDYVTEQLKFRKQQDQYLTLSENLKKKMNVQVKAFAAPEPGKPVPGQPTPKKPE